MTFPTAAPAASEGKSASRLAASGDFDIFPLPLMPVPGRSSSKLGRGTGQRVSRRHAVAASANEAIWALNTLSGGGHEPPLGANSARDSVVASVVTACERIGGPPPDLTPKAALAALLGSKLSPYEGGPCTAAPYEASRLSLPVSGGVCRLAAVLEVSDALELVCF